MRRFAQAAVAAFALSGPVLAGVLVDHSVVSVLGKPSGGTGPCSSSCIVGGADLNGAGQGNGAANSGGAAAGGHIKQPFSGSADGTQTGSGTLTDFNPGPGTPVAGHYVIDTPDPAGDGTASGNFTDPSNPKGHCTGSLASRCS
jgi:hypothetical protein